MSDLYTPEEIRDIFDRYNAELIATGRVSADLAREFADATKGVKDYTRTLNANLKMLGQASKQAGQDIINGAKGTSMFNNSIESAGNTVAHMAKQFGVMGRMIGGAVKALATYIIAVNKQSDALYNNFQQLSRSGVIGARGMDDVFQNMQRFGYTINELDKMSAVLIENSKDFAVFGGTAATGSKNLANLVKGMEDSRVQFFNLGMTVDDIVRAGAGYYRQLGVLGRANEATSTGAKAYIREMETLTRLTGLQRKEIEDQLEQAQEQNNFYAEFEELSPAAQSATRDVLAFAKSLDPSGKFSRGIVQSFSGLMIGGEEQAQLFQLSGGRIFEFIDALKSGQMSAADFKKALGLSSDEVYSTAKAMSIYNGDLFGQMKTLKLLSTTGQNADKSLATVTKEVDDLINGVSGATKAQSETRNNQILASNAVQGFINLGVNPLTQAFQFLTRVVERLTRFIPGSGREQARYEQETKEVAAQTAARVSGGIIDKIIQAESGGRNIGNIGGTSSAFGIGQITKGTFEGLVKQSTPGSALHGKTFEEMKTNVGLQRQALSMLTTQNQAAISKAGFDTTDAATYLAHFLGSPTALAVLRSSDQTPVAQVVSEEQMRANANVFRAINTVGDLKAWAARKMGTAGPSGAFGFQGRLSGPMSGYSPNIRMHGDEEFSIRPAGGTTSSNSGASEGTMVKLIERVDNLIDLSRSQLYVNEKILKYQQ